MSQSCHSPLELRVIHSVESILKINELSKVTEDWKIANIHHYQILSDIREVCCKSMGGLGIWIADI